MWEYTASDFYTRERGSNQRLPNGNTLMADSALGRGFEVTSEGKRVWEFFTPHRNAEGQRATIVRMRRLEQAQIAALEDRLRP